MSRNLKIGKKTAAYVDDYALTHKSTFIKNRCSKSIKKSYREEGEKSEKVALEEF